VIDATKIIATFAFRGVDRALYDVKVTDAKSAKRADGRYDVTLEVEARKLYADGEGQETEAPLAESFDVGVLTVEPGRKGYDKSSVLAVKRTRVHSGKQTLTIVTDKEPNFVGVDPFNKWLDRNSDDNVKEATKAESLAAVSRL